MDTDIKQSINNAHCADKHSDSDESLEKLQKELSVCQEQSQSWQDKYFHLLADFQNFKKRLEKDQLSLKHTIENDILRHFLSILDNFDRALQEMAHFDRLSAEQKIENRNSFFVGIELIRKELYKLLENYGIKEMISYDTFDPELHEAVMYVQSDTHEPGDIVEILQKGYMRNGQVLRVAKVSIAQ